ncbi:hypothetical protein BDV19DRAFT_69812 [Aspergillus venezuelensis]
MLLEHTRLLMVWCLPVRGCFAWTSWDTFPVGSLDHQPTLVFGFVTCLSAVAYDTSERALLFWSRFRSGIDRYVEDISVRVNLYSVPTYVPEWVDLKILL